jgi:hypothetical protein
VNIGDPMPEGFSLWTGGTASADEALAAIHKNAPEAPSAEEAAASAFEDKPEVIDEDTTPEEPTEDKWEVPEITEILEGFGIDKLTTTDYSDDFAKLEEWKTSQLDEIDTRYEQKLKEQESKNKNATAALQAKLIKAGVSIDGTSFESATAGQEKRNADFISKIEAEMASEKAAVRKGYLEKDMGIRAQEREEAFTVMTTNINNMFKGYDLATDVWQAFSKRTSDQQALEQGAAEHLDKMVLEWAKLDNNARADNLKMLEGFVGDGLYDVYDQDVINMLGKIEDLNGLERGTLIDASVGGYWNRMSNISLKEAQTEQMLASADKTRQTTPLTVEQMKLDLEKTRGQIAKTRSDMANSQDGITKEEKEFFNDIENGLDDLSKGRQWGEVWNAIAVKHQVDPTSDDPEDKAQVDLIDRLLNKNFWYDNGIEEMKRNAAKENLEKDEPFMFIQTQE